MRVCAGLAVLLTACSLSPAQSSSKRPSAAAKANPAPEPPRLTIGPKLPEPKLESEKLTYDVEWRLIHAGTVVFETQKSHAELRLDSAGMVSALVKIHDIYSSDFEDGLCGTSSVMDSQEGKRHHEAKVTFDRARGRATYLERDVLKDSVLRSGEIEIPNCVHEVAGALLKLRTMTIDPGQSAQIPMSDGRHSAQVKVEGQDREEVKTPAGSFKTIRYEAFLLNGVIYPRKGRLQVWLSDDARHLPVQIRLRMNFPVGSVTLQLQKEEHP
jgi:Protein of unknown function (DUF3108)